MTMPELIHLFEEATRLEEKGKLQYAYDLCVQIDNDANCTKSLKMTVDRAMNRLTKNQQLNEKKSLVLEAANFLAADTAEEVKESKPSSKDNILNVDVFALESIPQIANKMPIKTEDYERMKEGIKSRGIINPLIALPNLKLVCGYNRWKIAKELELKTVPVIFKNIPENRLFEYAMKDNVERRQLSTEQIAEYVLDITTQGTGRPKKNSRDKTNEDIAQVLGVSERTVQRAKQFAKKVRANPQLKGQSIRSVIEGKDLIDHLIFKYAYIVGVNEEKMAEDLTKVVEELFNLDISNGDKLKLVVQAYRIKRA